MGSGLGGRSVVVAWWGEARVVGWGVGRVLELVMGLGVGEVLELVMGLLGGHRGVLVEPSWIGRSLVQCVSGWVFLVPDEVAAAVFVF